MKIYLDCFPCLARQAYEAVNFATDDEGIKEKVMRECLGMLSTVSAESSPPYMAALVHRVIKEHSGCDDPYLDIRKESNEEALKLYGKMKEVVAQSENKLETAIRIAIVGNVIDFGAPSRPGFHELPEIIDEILSSELHGGYIGELLAKIGKAENILVLADNAGEIVFDKVLLEELGVERCTYAVKGIPVLNDSVYSDAEQAGITDIVKVIDNGADAPGTVLEWCSDEFKKEFDSADLIISKGQGNFESLSSCKHEDIYFLLKAKCQLIAGHLGCKLGDYVVTSSNADFDL